MLPTSILDVLIQPPIRTLARSLLCDSLKRRESGRASVVVDPDYQHFVGQIPVQYAWKLLCVVCPVRHQREGYSWHSQHVHHRTLRQVLDRSLGR